MTNKIPAQRNGSLRLVGKRRTKIGRAEREACQTVGHIVLTKSSTLALFCKVIITPFKKYKDNMVECKLSWLSAFNL